MIQSKGDLAKYLARDMIFYRKYSLRDRFMYWLTQDEVYEIAKYVRYLRFEEYYHNTRKGPWGKLCTLYYLMRKNRLGNRLGFRIPANCFGPGLTIYHHGCIIVNDSARIGANCRLHGNNCIGNNGKTNDAPRIGDDLDLGFGASIIGGVHLGDRVKVGANAVVVRSETADDITLVGVPACPRA